MPKTKKHIRKNSKKRSKSKSGVGGKNYNWKIGNKVRSLGMPGHYTIKLDLGDKWLMEGPHYVDDVPKIVEFGGWEKLSNSKSKNSKPRSVKSKSTSKKSKGR